MCKCSDVLNISGVNGCSVTPSSAAVVAGDDLSLTCTTFNTSQYILFWRLESEANSAFQLYQAPISAIGVNREVAEGYLVNDSYPNIQVILTIVKASKSQANYYYCLCTGSASDFAYVSVLGKLNFIQILFQVFRILAKFLSLTQSTIIL